MTTSSEPPDRPPIERSFAWTCLLLNATVLPGLGSIRAQHRVSGMLQMILAFAGFGGTLAALVRLFTLWAPDFQWPDDHFWYYFAAGSFLVFGVAWAWSLVTGVILLRHSPRRPR